MGEVEAGRAEADHQHAAAGRGTRQRAAQVERIPARQQRIDLEAPRQRQHVLQGSCLDLRDVDRFLLLVDAGLHAVVADAVPGRRHQRIVDRRHRHGADREALALQEVHLRDLFLERAAGKRDAERRFLEQAGLAVPQASRAAVLALVVAPDAVVGVIERAHRIEARIGQCKSLAVTQQRPRQLEPGHAVDDFRLDRHEMLEVELVRHLEERPVAMARLAFGAVQRPGGVLRQRLDPGRRLVDLELRTQRVAHGEREGELPRFEIGERHRQGNRRRHRRPVERRRRIGLDRARDVALHEQPLAVVERREPGIALAQRGNLRRNPEQRADEIFQRTGKLDQEIGFILGRETVGRDARRHQSRMRIDVRILQPADECGIEAAEALAVVKIVEAQPVGERGGGHFTISREAEGSIVRVRTD